MEVTLDSGFASEILEHLRFELQSSRKNLDWMKEKFPEDSLVNEFAYRALGKQAEMIQKLEVALGCHQEAQVGDEIELVKSLGIYGVAGRRGKLVARVKPKDLHENRAWESEAFGISIEDYWTVYFPPDPKYADCDLECVVHRREFLIIPK